MIHEKSSWLAAGIVALTLAFGGCRQDQTVTLTIFHTNDLHSHMHPPKSDEFGLGGIARLATLLTSLRQSHPNSLTLDAGDWSESSWYYSIDTGANMLRLLDTLKYDATVVGNHDYLNGPDRLYQTVVEAQPAYPVLAANLDFSAYTGAEEFKKHVVPTAIIVKGGLKIGIIGLTTIDYPFASYLRPLQATDPMKEAQDQARLLRPQVDVLLVLSHNLFTTNVQLGREIAGVDAVISGHSHKKVGQAVVVDNAGRKVPVVETGCWGRFLGELNLQIDPVKKTVTFAGYTLHPVAPELAEDPAVARQIAAEDVKLNALYGGNTQEAVAETDAELRTEDSHEASLGDLAVKSYREASGSQVAMEAMALTGTPIPKGPVTVMDLHDVLPHILDFRSGKEWTIKVWNAKGSDLGLIVNILYFTNALPLERSGFVAWDGLEVTWDPKYEGNPVPKIATIKVGGELLDVNKRYSVALTDGLLLALEIVNQKLGLQMDLSGMQDTGEEGWRAILTYGTNVKKLTAQGLRTGGRSYTTIADPAIFHYGISYDGAGLAVEVTNEGLARAEGVKLRCLAGLADNSIAYDTEQETFTPIGEADVPGLAFGESATVQVAWQPADGIWPVRCELVAPLDGYPGNSTASKVLHIRQGHVKGKKGIS